MKNFIISVLVILSAAFSLSSCLGEGTEYTYYDDAAITGFSIGTLNLYYHTTTSAGEDSTYKRTLDCSTYKFYIDQRTREIWNPDSLPVEIDATKVLCSITTKNNASAYIQHVNSDSLDNYSSTDSIDFSTPRKVIIYNNSHTGYQTYTIRVNVHKQVGDTCVWSKVSDANEALGRLKAMKAIAVNGNVYVFGNDGVLSKIYFSAEDDGVNWSEIPVPASFSTDIYKNVVLKDGKFFVLSNGQVLSSSDAASWTVIANADIRQLVAASSFALYALTNDGKLVASSDEGVTWTEESLDESEALLPFDNISYAVSPLSTNAGAEKLLLYGSRSIAEFAEDATAVVWTKVVESAAGSRYHQWNNIGFAPENKHKAPRLTNMQIVNYDNEIIAIGGKGIGACENEGLDRIYRSGDGGITWRNDSVMSMSEYVNSDKAVFGFTVDSKNYVWIICGGTGRVVKGCINRLVWKKEQDYFTEAKKRYF